MINSKTKSGVSGRDNNVISAENSIVSGGWKNIILEAVVNRRKLQDSNVGAHTIIGGSTNKI